MSHQGHTTVQIGRAAAATLCLLVVASACGALPGASLEVGTPAAVGGPTAVGMSEPPSPVADIDPTGSPVPVVADARSTAQKVLRTESGATCLTESIGEYPAEFLDEIVAEASAAGPDSGWVASRRAYVGDLEAAIAAFGGTTVARDEQSAWLIDEVAEPDSRWDAPAGTLYIEELWPLEGPAGSTIWFRSGNSIVAGTCAEE
ncbi:MAG: hypothetical protein H0V12_08125 [Chloroflexi bacterium]|nr:hypothetical protein [Chloroflexota bacterium]